MKQSCITVLFFLLCINARAQNETLSPIVSQADGFVIIQNAKMQPDKKRIYRAIYDATRSSKDSSQILPALNMAGSELNALGVCGIPTDHAKFVIVFHGAAIYSILDNSNYKKIYGIDNPNLKVLEKLRQSGVKLFVCGQNLLAEKIDPRIISPDVEVASDALIVLMSFQNDGYALMSF